MIALFDAEASGVGDHVDVSMMETQAGNIDRRALTFLSYQYTGQRGSRLSNDGGGMGAGIFPAEDGYVALNAATLAARNLIPDLIESP